MLSVPVLFIIFNRLATTRRVFEAIRQQRPAKLFIVSDGPRTDKSNEAAICEECRQIVMSGIDWNCEVKTLFREENLGCGKGVASAIDWFFKHVEEGIILEDDVLPNKTFFSFCTEMLERFRTDTKIMHISGNNFQLSSIGLNSYYLSKIPHSWGWATWKRAWQKFDFELKSFDQNNQVSYFNFKSIDNFWHDTFKKTKEELYQHVWDYQWTFTIFHHDGLCVLPQYNLVTNIGFGENASHTSDAEDYLGTLKAYGLELPTLEQEEVYQLHADINFHKLFNWETPDKPEPKSLLKRTYGRIRRISKM